jgi:hypothetical protein
LGWVAKGQILDVGLISALTGALQNTALNEKPLLDDSILAHSYRQGTEMGLLGLHSIKRDIYATDGSLEGGKMGNVWTLNRSQKTHPQNPSVKSMAPRPLDKVFKSTKNSLQT